MEKKTDIQPARDPLNGGDVQGNRVPILPWPEIWAGLDTYKPGSESDFVRLYEREALRLTRTVYGILGDRAEAEDCVQEAFARAYCDWANWKPTAPARFWVQRIAINLALSRRRHQKLAAVKERLLHSAPRRDADDIAGSADLLRCLRQLPVKQLTVVLMRFNHGYNNRDIALSLGISDRAVGQRMEAGLKRLGELLGTPGP